MPITTVRASPKRAIARPVTKTWASAMARPAAASDQPISAASQSSASSAQNAQVAG